MSTTPSPSTASQQTAGAPPSDHDSLSYWEGLSLEVESERQISRDLNPAQKSQLLYIMKSCYWGDAKTIEDCSNEMIVDNGIMLYKELKGGDARRFYYWQAYFGGNPSGYLLAASSNGEEGWRTLVENCDGDFIWQGPGDKRPLDFLNQVKKIAMGRYYDEEEDLITDE